MKQVAQLIKNLPANGGDTRHTSSIPGSGRSPEIGNGKPLQCSCLENSRERRAWQATVYGIAENQNWMSMTRTNLSVQALHRGQLFENLWAASYKVSLSFTYSWSLLKLMSIESVMPYNHLNHCPPLLLLPPLPPSIRVFSSESILHIRWPKYWSFNSASVLPMNVQDWFPLGLNVWISLQSKELSRVFSNSTVQKHQFFGAQISLLSNSHIHTWLLEKP